MITDIKFSPLRVRTERGSVLPTIKLGRHSVTRLIVGGNPFSGNSHISRERDIEMRNYYTVEKIKETLRQCEDAGINAWQSRGDNFITRVLNEHRMEGGRLQWIAQTASERRDTIANIHQIAEFEPIAMYHHGTRTDHFYRQGSFDEVVRYLDEIRRLSAAGVSATHAPGCDLPMGWGIAPVAALSLRISSGVTSHRWARVTSVVSQPHSSSRSIGRRP